MPKKAASTGIPTAKIKAIAREDKDFGRINEEALIIVGNCVEQFARDLVASSAALAIFAPNDAPASARSGKGMRKASGAAPSASSLLPSHIKGAITSHERYDFLEELVSNVADAGAKADIAPAGIADADIKKGRSSASAAPRGARKARGKDWGAAAQAATAAAAAAAGYSDEGGDDGAGAGGSSDDHGGGSSAVYDAEGDSSAELQARASAAGTRNRAKGARAESAWLRSGPKVTPQGAGPARVEQSSLPASEAEAAKLAHAAGAAQSPAAVVQPEVAEDDDYDA